MYFVRRILFAAPLLLLISAMAFGLVRLAPGGPFDRERAFASPEVQRNVEAKYHLDEPVWKQYLRYLDDLAHGDFGVSCIYRNQTVGDIIAQGLPVSMTLGGLAFCFALLVGLPLGFWTAANRGRWQDFAGNFFAILMVCVPGMVVAPLLILIFSIKLKWFPVGLWETPWHMVLPSIALGLFYAGKIARIFREGMLQAAQSEFVSAARAKGLTEPALLLKHATRIAVLPVVSYAGPMLADLLTGSFIIENVFQVPGMGVFLVNSVHNRDVTVIVGLSLLYAMLLIGLNLAVDFIYTVLDPRVKYE